MRAVFFDFGGTLCHSRADILPFFQEAARRAGVTLPWKEYLEANEACWNELWPSAPSLVGQVPSFADRVHEQALHRVGFKGPTETLVQLIREEAISSRWHVPFPESEATVGRLRARGYSVHIISGNVDYLPLVLVGLGWSHLFDTVTYTQEVGVQKPDPRVFEFALCRAGREPSDSTYVGDSWDADYRGALGAGMDAIWLNRQGAEPPEPCRQIRDLTELEASLPPQG